VLHWQRQVGTPYADLSEAEKESDRKEADRVLAALREAAGVERPSGGWQPIETAPRECEAVLTQHVDDVYPAVAFCVTDADGTEVWCREMEGPEDEFDDEGRKGRFEPLYRTPTHWMPLPAPPAAPSTEEK
jgi:hypothetical protein